MVAVVATAHKIAMDTWHPELTVILRTPPTSKIADEFWRSYTRR